MEAERAHVLVVDDIESNRDLLCEVLETLGYGADAADSGQEAVRRVAQRRYSAVLMDCQMPGMDGFEATGEIRRRESRDRRMPIIAVTALGPEARERALAAGMDDLISKPFDLDRFERVLAEWTRAPADMPHCSAAGG